MTLNEFLLREGFNHIEGYSRQFPQQVEDLILLTHKPNIKIMEIGFNAGHSTDTILTNNPNLTMVSFDLGMHSYVATAKSYIDNVFPFRHTLIIGDSRFSVPTFIRNYPDIRFDIIFIDGGHGEDIALSDLDNCFHLAHKDTIVIMDDMMMNGPRNAWFKRVQDNMVIEWKHRKYNQNQGMSWGVYNKEYTNNKLKTTISELIVNVQTQ